ncbi:MAG: zinc-ribbon domain-containing protein [Candidatus Lokiarchaeota archaeon]|nr:zinc-ribbon domain-containing protein [Candidatus Lokiarchaeota archaeon]
MLSKKLLICSKCKSENIIGYQIIQTNKQIIVNYRCIGCGNRDEIKLDISEKEYFSEGLSNLFFRCYKCGGPIIIEEKKDNGRAAKIVYQCIERGRRGKKKISSVLYHDLRTLYLNKDIKKEQNITISLLDKQSKIECPKCKNMVNVNSKFCSFCGTNLKEVKLKSNICTNCGAQIKKGSNFCTKCGAPLQKSRVDSEVDESDDPFENYVECHFCGASVPDNNICPACGAELKCRKCNILLKPGAKFCHSCGEKVPQPMEEEEENNYLECPECGEKVSIGYTFCTGCGYNMEEVEPSKGNNKNGSQEKEGL